MGGRWRSPRAIRSTSRCSIPPPAQRSWGSSPVIPDYRSCGRSRRGAVRRPPGFSPWVTGAPIATRSASPPQMAPGTTGTISPIGLPSSRSTGMRESFPKGGSSPPASATHFGQESEYSPFPGGSSYLWKSFDVIEVDTDDVLWAVEVAKARGSSPPGGRGRRWTVRAGSLPRISTYSSSSATCAHSTSTKRLTTRQAGQWRPGTRERRIQG